MLSEYEISALTEERAKKCVHALGLLAGMNLITHKEYITIRNRTIITEETFIPIK